MNKEGGEREMNTEGEIKKWIERGNTPPSEKKEPLLSSTSVTSPSLHVPCTELEVAHKEGRFYSLIPIRVDR